MSFYPTPCLFAALPCNHLGGERLLLGPTAHCLKVGKVLTKKPGDSGPIAARAKLPSVPSACQEELHLLRAASPPAKLPSRQQSGQMGRLAHQNMWDRSWITK